MKSMSQTMVVIGGFLFLCFVIWRGVQHTSDAGNAAAGQHDNATWVSARGQLATGEEIYWAATHEDMGTIQGVNRHLDENNDGHFMDGVSIIYKSDGAPDWKDRDFIDSGQWLVRTDDPKYGSTYLADLAQLAKPKPDDLMAVDVVPMVMPVHAIAWGFACKDRGDFDRIAQLIKADDPTQATTLLNQGIASTSCEKFEKGEAFESSATESGYAVIHREGSDVSYWTSGGFFTL